MLFNSKNVMNDITKYVLICQSKACSKQGAAKVMEAFQANPVPHVTVTASQCLGQCGNGPMVLIEPDRVWYDRVNPNEVPTVVEKHLRNGQPVKGMLYHKFHHN